MIVLNLNLFFQNKLESLSCSEITRSYVVGTLSKYKNSEYDYSNESLTLLYDHAQTTHDFYRFQNLADWILFCEIIFPSFLSQSSKDYYHSLAKGSYYNCYNLIGRKIDVYGWLSDDFTKLTHSASHLIQNI